MMWGRHGQQIVSGSPQGQPPLKLSASAALHELLECSAHHYVEMEYCELLCQLEAKHSDKELYWIIAQSRPVQMISY